MRILFDQGTPVPLKGHLKPHEVDTAAELGWPALTNGDLLTAAEAECFYLLVTTDQNLRYQQNLDERSIGIIVLMTTSWPRIREAAAAVLRAVNELPEGGYAEVPIE